MRTAAISAEAVHRTVLVICCALFQDFRMLPALFATFLLVCASGLASREAQAVSPPPLGQQPAASPSARAATPRRWTVSIVTGPTSTDLQMRSRRLCVMPA